MKPHVVAGRIPSFAGDVLKLASGAAIAQALGILITPILTRLYAPEAFGVLAVFTSITSILSVIVCMRYELAIMLPEKDEEASHLLVVSLGFTVLLALLTIPVIWWWRAPLVDLLDASRLESYLWLVPVMVFFAGIFLALNHWNSRKKCFGRVSVGRVIQAGSTHSVKLGAGFAGYVTSGVLIIANVLGQAIAAAVLAAQTWRDDGQMLWQSISWEGVLQGIKRYHRFPLYGSWSILLGTTAWQLPVLLLARYFSASVVAYYALGFRILQMPMSLVGNAVNQVFFQRAAEAQNTRRLSALVEELFRRTVMIGLLPTLMLTIIGRDLYLVVFGPDWAEAGVYTQILSIWGFVWFASGPLTKLFAVLEKQGMQLGWNIANLLMRVTAIVAGGYLQNPRLTMVFLALAGTVIYGCKVVITLRLAEVPTQKTVAILLQYTFLSAPMAIGVLVLRFLGVSVILQLLATGTLVCAYMGYASWKAGLQELVRFR